MGASRRWPAAPGKHKPVTGSAGVSAQSRSELSTFSCVRGEAALRLSGLPAPAVVVLAGDRLVVSGDAAGAVVALAAVLAGLVTVS
jgi:hypothetical protein